MSVNDKNYYSFWLKTNMYVISKNYNLTKKSRAIDKVILLKVAYGKCTITGKQLLEVIHQKYPQIKVSLRSVERNINKISNIIVAKNGKPMLTRQDEHKKIVLYLNPVLIMGHNPYLPTSVQISSHDLTPDDKYRELLAIKESYYLYKYDKVVNDINKFPKIAEGLHKQANLYANQLNNCMSDDKGDNILTDFNVDNSNVFGVLKRS